MHPTDRRLPYLGVGTPLGFGLNAPRLVAYARAADDAGLHDVSVGELRSTEVFSLAAAMVAHTRRVRIETSIVAAVTRAPTLIGMAASTLAQLSEGRFVLGVGAGSPIVAGWHERELTKPLQSVERTVRLVRAVVAGERVPELGAFKIAEEMRADVRIIISAMNPRMLELAARVADGVVVQFCSPAQTAQIATDLRRIRANAGISNPFEVIANVWGHAGRRAEALPTFRREVGPYLAVPTYRAAAIALSSVPEVDAAAQLWRSGGRDAAADAVPTSISDAVLLAFGDDDVTGRLAAYRASGVDRVRVIPLSPVAGDDRNALDVVARLGAIENA